MKKKVMWRGFKVYEWFKLRTLCLKEAERIWGKPRYAIRRNSWTLEAGPLDENRGYQPDKAMRANSWKELLAQLKETK